MILVIDNYDSFVFNLARYVREAGSPTMVVRNDSIDVREALGANPAGVVLSPGPNRPDDAGICLELLAALPASLPVLGVCLGHQCIVQALGGKITRAGRPLHGEAALIRHDGTGLFAGRPETFLAGRYHSLIGVIAPGGELIANAWSEEGEVMAVRRRGAPWHGVQFHPESLLTPEGPAIIANFLKLTARAAA